MPILNINCLQSGAPEKINLKKLGKQSRSRATIDTILEAAIQVLIDCGYEKATTNRIAVRSGFGVGTIYQYFEDKEDVYREMVDRELEKVAVAVSESIPGNDLTESLTAVIFAVSKTARENPGSFYSLEPLIAERFRESRNEARERIIAGLARLLQHHHEEIDDHDPRLAARRVVTVAEGFALNADPTYFSSSDLELQVLKLVMATLIPA